jgi:exodeoxyribonuclease III
MVAENLKDKFPAEYLQYWNCCKPPIRGYAGTIIFTKIKPISVVYDIGTPKHDREGRTITLEFEKFFLVGVYVPNSGATLKWHEYRTNEWDLDFRAYLKGLERKGKPVVLAGDLNVAH